jgi:hypothetical protein
MNHLDRIREYCERATKGEWEVGIRDDGKRKHICPTYLDSDYDDVDCDAADADITFVLSARTDLPRLVNALEPFITELEEQMQAHAHNTPEWEVARRKLEKVKAALEGKLTLD